MSPVLACAQGKTPIRESPDVSNTVYSGMYLPPDSLPNMLAAAQSLACSGQPVS